MEAGVSCHVLCGSGRRIFVESVIGILLLLIDYENLDLAEICPVCLFVELL